MPTGNSVVIIHPDLPEKDGGNTATVPERSLHVWKSQGWKVAPKTEQPKPATPKS